MRLTNWALAAALAAVLPSTAWAQWGATGGLRQPSSVRQTAYEYSDYYAEPTAGSGEAAAATEEPAAEPAAKAAAGCCDDACDDGCDDSCDDSCDKAAAAEPFRIFGFPALTERNMYVGGFLAQGIAFNPQNPADRFNGPVTWMDRSNEWNINQFWLWMYKETDTEGYGVDIGGRVDTFFGTDRRFTSAGGLEDKWNFSSAFYGISMPSLYAELAVNDFKVKAGHFISPVGYFTIQTNLNFFNTLPYTYQYGEPFTHTGVWATYDGIENLSIGGGFTRGWDTFAGFNPHLGTLGTMTYTTESGISYAYVNMWTHEPNQVGEYTDRYFQTQVLSLPLSERLNWIIQSDFGVQGRAIAQTLKTARWYGLNQYMFYTVSDAWKWGIGFEWFRDEEGFRVGNLVPNAAFGAPPPARGWGLAPDGTVNKNNFVGNFFQITAGPLWTPARNLIVRPNVRWDWYDGAVNQNNLLPYDNGTRRDQFLFATDFILSY